MKILSILFLTSACAFAAPPADKPLLTTALGMTFVVLPPGEFTMGSPIAYATAMAEKVTWDWYRNSPRSEAPPRRVKLAVRSLRGKLNFSNPALIP